MDFTYQPVERYRAIMALLFTTHHFFNSANVGKQLMAWEGNFQKYW